MSIIGFPTEEQARAMWCPHARVARIENDPNTDDRDITIAGVNRDALGRSKDPSSGCRCIAGNCMAWRAISLDNGYCGLAGRPE